MTEYSVLVSDEVCKELEQSLNFGPMLDDNGLRQLNEELVDRIDGLKVEVFSNEHPPPHFRVKYQGHTANFEIKDCTVINGDKNVLKFEKNIKCWWKKNKQALIDTWNETRPSDCPVGVYRGDATA